MGKALPDMIWICGQQRPHPARDKQVWARSCEMADMDGVALWRRMGRWPTQRYMGTCRVLGLSKNGDLLGRAKWLSIDIRVRMLCRLETIWTWGGRLQIARMTGFKQLGGSEADRD